jgi:hypothetical protein
MQGQVLPNDLVVLALINSSARTSVVFSEHFRGGVLVKVFQSEYASVYTDVDGTVIAKISDASIVGRATVRAEVVAVRRLNDLAHTPKHLRSGEEPFGFIIMKHLGTDGIDLIGPDATCGEFGVWERLAHSSVMTLNNIHECGVVHGDIKLENLTYDGEQWHFIDFGFAFDDGDSMGKGFNGTFPFVLPFYGSELAEDDERRIASDRFALVMTILTFGGALPQDRCSRCKYRRRRCVGVCGGSARCSRVNILEYVQIEQCCTLLKVTPVSAGVTYMNVVRLLCEFVLTQLRRDRHYLIWEGGRCEYFGITQIQNPPVRKRSMWEVWEELTSALVVYNVERLDKCEK